jgi:hypothetical protein
VDAYANTGVPNGLYFPAGANVEVLDDLHLGGIRVTDLCAFDIGYFKAGPGVTTATVVFYANNAGDSPPGATLATFTLPGLPAGENAFHVEVPSSSLTQEVWLGVAFDAADAGLQLARPAWPGTSDDWFLMRPPNQYFNFGGNPRSDFMLGVYAQGYPVGVDPGEERPLVAGFHREPGPNPSRRGIELAIAAPAGGRVRVDVVDVSGRVVAVIADRMFEPGIHPLVWDGAARAGSRVAAGVYMIRVTMKGFAGSRKVALIQ